MIYLIRKRRKCFNNYANNYYIIKYYKYKNKKNSLDAKIKTVVLFTKITNNMIIQIIFAQIVVMI